MNKENRQQMLADALSALEGSQARTRLLRLFDEGSFVEIDRFAQNGDKPVEAAAGYGTVDGNPVYAFAQDRDLCCGAVGKAQAAKICKIYQLAAQNGAPVVGIFDSDGAQLDEGVGAMDALADMLFASNTLSGVVPQIAVIAGACVGSSAIVAANTDVVIAAKDADYYLNPGDDNMPAAITAADADAAVDTARQLAAMLPANNLAVSPALDYDNAEMPAGNDAVRAMEGIADVGTLLMLGDGENPTAFARVGGSVCGLVALAQEKVCGKQASKVTRFVRLCDSFSIPVITFVDTEGFENLEGAAKLSHAYAEATTVKLTVLTGKVYGAVYIAVAGKSAGADLVLAWPEAAILSLPPQAAIHIFWKDRLANMANPAEDREKLAQEYAATEGSVLTAAAKGYVTDVVTPSETKQKLIAMLDMLSGKRVSRLPKKHSNIVL